MNQRDGSTLELSGELELIAAAVSPGLVLTKGLADVISRVCMEAQLALEGREKREG